MRRYSVVLLFNRHSRTVYYKCSILHMISVSFTMPFHKYDWKRGVIREIITEATGNVN